MASSHAVSTLLTKDLVRSLFLILLALALALSGGCADRPALPPIPADKLDAAEVPGFGPIRQWGDAPGPLTESLQQARGTAPLAPLAPPDASFDVLAISGGAANGSFAAGLLTGWTKAGTRPAFDVVTGVSVGALEAPFAFLGPGYDTRLRALCDRLASTDILRQRPALLAYFSDAWASEEPLVSLIDEFVDDALVAAIATEHRKGRRLYVGTTHVYAGRPVIWDIGGIAASGRPDATALVRKVVLASAAVPAMLPPVYFDVVADGRQYHEMHVDGGIARTVFIGPPGVDWAALAQADGTGRTGRPVRFHVIRNGRARGEYMIMQPRALQLAQHAMMQLTQSLGVGDLYRIYVEAQRHGVDYRAAWIGDDFDAPWQDWEGAGYMRALFDYGHRLAVDGQAWHAQPPGL
jgi:hypothetical protein